MIKSTNNEILICSRSGLFKIKIEKRNKDYEISRDLSKKVISNNDISCIEKVELQNESKFIYVD